MANELKPCPFCGSKARMWPSQTKSDSEGSYEIIGCSNVDCLMEPTTDEYLPYAEAVIRWNTRPAAPVEGLETISFQRLHPRAGWVDCMADDVAHYKSVGQAIREGVDRSQAEAIIAALTARVKALNTPIEAVDFLYKHGELTYGAAKKAIDLLIGNGFYVGKKAALEAKP